MGNKIKEEYYLSTKENTISYLFQGKPLGFINRQQFFHIYKDPIKFVRKVLSCPPKTLEDLEHNKLCVLNHRLLFSTTGKNMERQLFISAELKFMTAISAIGDQVLDFELIDVNNKIIYLERK